MVVAEITVRGRVQGVGFRYFTQRAATRFGIVGWVKNMPDGSVCMRAAGSEEAMKPFREQIRKGPTFGRVDQLDETPLKEAEATRFNEFQITY